MTIYNYDATDYQKNPCPDNGTEVPLYEAHEIDTITDQKRKHIRVS